MLFSGCTGAHAQSSSEVDLDESWALQFQVNGNFTLGGFQGALVSAKKQYDARRAFRFGVGLDARFQRGTEERGDQTEMDRNSGRQSLRLNAQWIRYLPADGEINPYWGVGPTARFNRVVSEREADEFKRANGSLGGGVGGVLGAEWFVHPQISLVAEYRAEVLYRYTWTRREDASEGDQDDRTRRVRENQFQLGGQAVLLGISVYL